MRMLGCPLTQGMQAVEIRAQVLEHICNSLQSVACTCSTGLLMAATAAVYMRHVRVLLKRGNAICLWVMTMISDIISAMLVTLSSADRSACRIHHVSAALRRYLWRAEGPSMWTCEKVPFTAGLLCAECLACHSSCDGPVLLIQSILGLIVALFRSPKSRSAGVADAVAEPHRH